MNKILNMKKNVYINIFLMHFLYYNFNYKLFSIILSYFICFKLNLLEWYDLHHIIINVIIYLLSNIIFIYI